MRQGSGPAVRLLVHALDRTGPPMLALALARWLVASGGGPAIETIAFRGGPLQADLEAYGPVEVVLDHHEPWDVAHPPPERAAQLARRFRSLAAAEVNLLVSVAASQVLPLLPTALGPVATWVVEIGDDLHWLDERTGVIDRTTDWWAGSAASADALASHPALAHRSCSLVPEFIDEPVAVPHEVAAARRDELEVGPGDLLVVGAGIGTWRKGIDLFAEAAVALGRRLPGAVRCHWVGGSDDPLWPVIDAERDRPELAHLSLEPPVADLAPTFAAADVVLHPARCDAFPLVCVQAAALGAPVVGFSGVGGLTEMLGASFLGAPYPDLDALVEHVVELAQPAERRRAAAAQQDAVAAHLAPAAGPVVAEHLRRVAMGARP